MNQNQYSQLVGLVRRTLQIAPIAFRTAMALTVITTCLTHAQTAVPQLGGTQISATGGSVNFHATTNVPALGIHGKSTALAVSVTVAAGTGELALERIDAHVPVSSLATGLSLRDRHMREQIFAAGTDTPDVRFTAPKVTCKLAADCSVEGVFAFHGVAKPLNVILKIREDGSKYKIAGQATVKLSDYGIDPPSQVGVRVKDEVRFTFDFNAPVPAQLLSQLGGR
jgi:polyisoprenoid-binding protein YceI